MDVAPGKRHWQAREASGSQLPKVQSAVSTTPADKVQGHRGPTMPVAERLVVFLWL